MSENIHNKQVFSLLEVTRSIQTTLNNRYASPFWVKAEMNKLNPYPYSGHCFPELVEKVEGKVVAQMRANLWRRDYLRINDHFQAVLKEPLKDGIKILFAAKINFDPEYGLALQILDIDPNYTLGDLEREKQETIARLKAEELYHKNKMLPLPLLPKRLAVVSVETSKGYADFRKVIDTNPWGYQFFQYLFPALLQGEKAVESIRVQLNRIRKVKHHFDVVVIIRGGGGDIGLSCYNHYLLAREIALFPLPVITGIGHATNDTVCEMIAFHNAITPTKMAEFLIQQFHDFSVPVQEAEEKIVDKAKRLIQEEKTRFQATVRFFRSITTNRLGQNHHLIQRQSDALIRQSRYLLRRSMESQHSCTSRLGKGTFTALHDAGKEVGLLVHTLKRQVVLFQRNQHNALDHMGKQVDIMDPKNVLKRGYSLTLAQGKAVTRLDQIAAGEVITTILADGRVISEIRSIEKTESHD